MTDFPHPQFVQHNYSTSIYGMVALIVSSLLLWCLVMANEATWGDDEPVHGQIPAEIIDQVKAILSEDSPDGKVLEDEPGQFRYGDRIISVKSHGVYPNGHIPKISHVDIGPKTDGFILQLRWFPHTWKGYMSGIYSYGQHFPRDYWKEYLAHYKLPDSSGYIELRWNYGALTNQDMLAKIQSIVASVGSLEKDASADARWDDKIAKAKEPLMVVMNKYHIDAKWNVLDRSLTCEFKTMEFDIHAIDDQGNVALEAHRETGPQMDGLIIRISPIKSPLRRQPRPVYGRSYGPYWRHYHAIYNEDFEPIRLDILYGVNTDKRLLEDVTAALDDLFGKPDRF